MNIIKIILIRLFAILCIISSVAIVIPINFIIALPVWLLSGKDCLIYDLFFMYGIELMEKYTLEDK
jgi:hypothetical protein